MPCHIICSRGQCPHLSRAASFYSPLQTSQPFVHHPCSHTQCKPEAQPPSTLVKVILAVWSPVGGKESRREFGAVHMTPCMELHPGLCMAGISSMSAHPYIQRVGVPDTLTYTNDVPLEQRVPAWGVDGSGSWGGVDPQTAIKAFPQIRE